MGRCIFVCLAPNSAVHASGIKTSPRIHHAASCGAGNPASEAPLHSAEGGSALPAVAGPVPQRVQCENWHRCMLQQSKAGAKGAGPTNPGVLHILGTGSGGSSGAASCCRPPPAAVQRPAVGLLYRRARTGVICRVWCQALAGEPSYCWPDLTSTGVQLQWGRRRALHALRQKCRTCMRMRCRGRHLPTLGPLQKVPVSTGRVRRLIVDVRPRTQ